jgi:hypothetical protein
MGDGVGQEQEVMGVESAFKGPSGVLLGEPAG